NDDGVVHGLGGTLGVVAVTLDDADGDRGVGLFDAAGDVTPDIAGTGDDHAAGWRFFAAEEPKHALHLVSRDGDNGLVAGDHLLMGVDHPHLAFAAHGHHRGVEVGEKVGQMPQGGVDHRAVFGDVDLHHHDLPVLEGDDLVGAGIGHAL